MGLPSRTTRPASPLTTEGTEVSEEDLLTASRPEIMPQVSGLLSAPLLGDLAATPVQPAATCMLSPSPESVKVSRNFTRTTLCDWGMSALTDLAELVVSELVTNAVRHGVPPARKLAGQQCVRL